jgi:hypothetical protein
MKKKILLVLTLVLGIAVEVVNSATNNQAPIADAGLPRYAGTNAVILDGTGSYDPDNSGSLSYTWQQVTGPSVTITDANTATPTISGFSQTDEIRECEFELIVSDGELNSLPDYVKVIVVPDFGSNLYRQENPPFDANKPTIIYFGGGDCTNGLAVDGWSPFTSDWLSRANIIYFPNGYTPDSGGNARTYYKYGDMIIVYLSAVAPDYKQPIQTSGWSTGGQPAIDVGIHLNLIYADTRYAVNRVTFLDAIRYCRSNYSESISTFLDSSVDGEQCWADAYVSTTSGGSGYVAGPNFQENVLNVGFPNAMGDWYSRHILASGWYANSLILAEMNDFNHGVVAGAYWSVVGPGKNLQLASRPGEQTYRFNWYGDESSGYMDFYDESNHPGRPPEPVILSGPQDGTTVDVDGAVFSCEVSENSIGYQLLFGCDPYHMVYLISDTSTPPNEQINIFPFEQTWWTVKAYDQYGSTIYADPICINTENVIPQTIENITTTRQYSSIQQAINDALDGQEIVISPGICLYYENIDFKGKSLTIRSIDPNDPDVIANTIIYGSNRGPIIKLSGSHNASCLLAGLTITGGTVGISCSDAAPKIQNCTVGHEGSIAIEYWDIFEPTIIDCNILGQINELIDPRLAAHWPLDETEGQIAYDSSGYYYDASVIGDPNWQPEGGMVDGALEFDGINDCLSTPFVLNPYTSSFSVFAWIKGGNPGEVILSQADGVNWLLADSVDGCLMTEIRSIGVRSEKMLVSSALITDGGWHRIGFVWDGTNRILYVDDFEVASDTQSHLTGSEGGLYIGTGNNMETGTFWKGLIDDVRIYDRVVTP